MQNRRIVLVRLVLILLVSLLAVCTVPVGKEQGGNAASWQLFAVAVASDTAPSGEADREAAVQEQYDAAQALLDAQEYKKAYEAFSALGTFSDSRAKAADSKRKWKAASYKEAIALYKAEKYDEAKAIFETLGDYEDSSSYCYTCNMKSLRLKYKQAEDLYSAGDYEGAQTLFASLGKFHDSSKRAQAAADMLAAQKQAAAELQAYEKALALKEAGDLAEARDAFIEAGDCKDATDQLYAVISMLDLRATYEKAEGYYAAADYENACVWFTALGDYEDSAGKATLSNEAWQASVYEQATTAQNSDPNSAYILFLFLGDYRDSTALADTLKTKTTEQDLYTVADAMAQSGDYQQAQIGFEAIPAYADSQERAALMSENVLKQKDYKQASYLLSIGELKQAYTIFKALGDFQNASLMIEPATTKFTAKQLRDDKTSAKSAVFTAPDGTKHVYQIYKGVHTWVEAKLFCEVLGGHLATLTTAEENTFVYQFMRDSGYLTAYFGLSDEKRTGDWIWVTGEPYEYSNWHKGQPSRSAHERYGMYFYKHTNGTWNDSHFYELVKVDPGCSYICEWDE